MFCGGDQELNESLSMVPVINRATPVPANGIASVVYVANIARFARVMNIARVA